MFAVARAAANRAVSSIRLICYTHVFALLLILPPKAAVTMKKNSNRTCDKSAEMIDSSKVTRRAFLSPYHAQYVMSIHGSSLRKNVKKDFCSQLLIIEPAFEFLADTIESEARSFL